MQENKLLNFISSQATPPWLARIIMKIYAFIHSGKSRSRRGMHGSTLKLKSPVYIMEGYHGGILYWDWLILRKGGLWEALIWPAVGVSLLHRAGRQKIPIVLELDAATFRHMAEHQRLALSRLKNLVGSGKIELVNGTFSQPLLQTISGEAVIRQFEHGLRAINETTGSRVRTYACQEPCFCSQLPQILKGFSIPFAILRTHWAPFGEEPGVNAPFITWEGPDGSEVKAVPRYGWMDYSHRSDMYKGALRGNLSGAHGNSQWNRKWLEMASYLAGDMGTNPMLVTSMEDLSPHESPISATLELAGQPGIHFTTPSSFFRDPAFRHFFENAPVCRFSTDDFIINLPWGLEGDSLINARDDAESALLAAERLDAVIHAFGAPGRDRELGTAWEMLLTAQHHDFHICGPWLSLAHGKTISVHAQDLCNEARFAAEGIINESLTGKSDSMLLEDADVQHLMLFNPHAEKTGDVFYIPGIWRVKDGEAEVQSLADINRTAFYHEIPPLGIKQLTIYKTGLLTGVYHSRNIMSFSNSFYSASSEGGTLSLTSGDNLLLNRGCFFSVGINGRMVDSRGSAISTIVAADGNILTRWETAGTLANIHYRQSFTLCSRHARIDVETEFAFEKNSVFGPESRDGRGFYSMEDRKLCVCFPVPSGIVIRSAPFIAERTNSESFIGNNWAGIENDGHGLAFICPGARGFHYDNDSGILRLVLAWSPSSWMYASDDSFTPNGSKYVGIKGVFRFRYSLLPYENRLEAIRAAEKARIPARMALSCLPPPPNLPDKQRLLSIEPDEVLLTALFARNGRIFGRLFNPTGRAVEARIISSLPVEISACDMSLDNELLMPDNRIRLRPYGVQTIGINSVSNDLGG